MCAQGDHPPYDPPTPTRPRRYVLSGDRLEPRASVALAAIGEMLNESENDLEAAYLEHDRRYLGYRLSILREARNRVMAAEARL